MPRKLVDRSKTAISMAVRVCLKQTPTQPFVPASFLVVCKLPPSECSPVLNSLLADTNTDSEPLRTAATPFWQVMSMLNFKTILTSHQATCGKVDSCSANGCDGALYSGGALCLGNKFGCPCYPDPIWVPAPPIIHNQFPPLQDPWYTVGLYEDDECFNDGCTHAYGLGAMDMSEAGGLYDASLNGIGHSTKDLCNAKIGPAGVICIGDITKQCSDPGVALYNSRTCRTYCPSAGDNQFAWHIFDGFGSTTLSTVLICDRALA